MPSYSSSDNRHPREQENEHPNVQHRKIKRSGKENHAKKRCIEKGKEFPTKNYRENRNLNPQPPVTTTDEDKHRPLKSIRDPRRWPLLGRLPFAPNLHHKDGLIQKAKKRPIMEREVYPAYAFRNAFTGDLEIKSGQPPESYFIDIERGVGNGDKGGITSKPALYPIAINGGGIGLYNDPREFGVGGISGFSRNNHECARTGPSRGLIVFPWNLGNTVHSDKKRKESDCSIGGPHHESWVDNSDIEEGLDETLRKEGRIGKHNSGSIFSPWKTWEKVHNYMVRIAERTDNLTGSDDIDQRLPTLTSKARISSVYNEDDYDFALILKPKEVYAFWADLLDFQEENGINTKGDIGDVFDFEEEEGEDISLLGRGSMEYPIDSKPFPYAGKNFTSDNERLRQRKNQRNSELLSPHRCKERIKMTPPRTEPIRKILFSPGGKSPPQSADGKIVSVDHSGHRIFKQRTSLFDRAVAAITPPRRSQRKKSLDPFHSGRKLVRSIRNSISKASSKSPLRPREISNETLSSLIETKKQKSVDASSETHLKSIENVSSKQTNCDEIFQKKEGKPCEQGENLSDYKNTKKRKRRKKSSRKKTSNTLQIENIPTQLVPRGIAARTNGMEEFLSSLKRGIIVKRHRSHTDSGVTIQIRSSDGGDTMFFEFVKRDEAVLSLNEQMVRYNRDTTKYSIEDFLGIENMVDEESQQEREIYDFSLPDDIAAEKYRAAKSRLSGGLKKKVVGLATKAAHSGTFKAADIVAVQRANSLDPFSTNGKCGTYTLRESKAKYNDKRTFSLVLLGGLGWVNGQSSLKAASEKWLEGFEGYGSNKNFRYLDIEAATEGDFWMIFRGFLLLQRDAASGRFATQRTVGFSSNYNKRELEQRSEELKKEGRKRRKTSLMMFQEPEETTWLQRILWRKKNYRVQHNTTMPSIPPSDYFLGFKSPGTQIWSRLRHAGLETHRIYALDTKRVMLKVRCPKDRLMDVSELLRLKLKTADGFFAPFQENMMSQFALPNDAERKNDGVSSLFRSADRQHLINFIIRSRIQDSGAGLEDKKLRKDIELMVPMHMHARLETLYISWVLFYKEINWLSERDAMNVNIGQTAAEQSHQSSQRSVPSKIIRFFVGSFYQPLDSVEEYFGERVTFYFAWLQHCSLHLISLSTIGLVVFLCQLSSDNYHDHPLRPYFSIIVMIWSFYVLVDWRKRQNFLSHRWGTMNYKEEETTRPQFHGVREKSEISGELEYIIHYPSWKRWLKYCISLPLLVVVTVTLLIVMLMVYANRDIFLSRYFSDNKDVLDFDFRIEVIGRKEAIGSVSITEVHLKDPIFWFIIIGIPAILGLALPLFNFILMQISMMLNEFENHRTETHYRNALIGKVIAFRFVCYFAALYYYAYIVIDADPKVVESGMLRVASCLIVYLTVANWWSIFLSIHFPLLLLRWRLFSKRLKLRDEVRKLEMNELNLFREKESTNLNEKRAEERKLVNKRLLLEQAQSKVWEEVMLPDYDPFSDYVQAIMNFAYVVCFSTILPIAPLFVLINQLLNMRLNAYKICRARRRPLAQKAGGIDVWEHVLHIVSVLAVLTNCSLMALTSSQFDPILKAHGYFGLFGVIVGWEHIMLLIKYIMQAHISPYPKSVLNDMKRERQENKKKRNSSLRAKKIRRSNPSSQGDNIDSQLISSRSGSSGKLLVNSFLKNSETILPVDEEESNALLNDSYELVNPDVPLTREIKSNVYEVQKQTKQRSEVNTRKSIIQSLNRENLERSKTMCKSESKIPKQEQHVQTRMKQGGYTSCKKESDDAFLDGPFKMYYSTGRGYSPLGQQPELDKDEENYSISGLLDFDEECDGQYYDENYDKSLGREAKERIEERLSNVEKRRSRDCSTLYQD